MTAVLLVVVALQVVVRVTDLNGVALKVHDDVVSADGDDGAALRILAERTRVDGGVRERRVLVLDAAQFVLDAAQLTWVGAQVSIAAAESERHPARPLFSPFRDQGAPFRDQGAPFRYQGTPFRDPPSP